MQTLFLVQRNILLKALYAILSKIFSVDEIKAHDGNVTSLDLGETGSVLVTGGQDRNVNLWAIGREELFMVNCVV